MAFNQNSEIIEIIVRDGTGSRIESRKFQAKDSKEITPIVNWLMEKYGFKIKVSKTWLDMESDVLNI